ncbi:hypothetical protein FS749_005945 [Ceratobasidium sp. UAMH 11750]|nr:hypothetical protein FS749_005945 [Ceratobasidium sp. UAMH 11750]
MLLAPTIIWHEEEENVANVMLPAFGPQTFARFEIYNAFVQKLIISNKWSLGKQSLTTVQLRSWSTLSYRVRRAPLLPNLHDLTIRGKFFDGEEVVIWLSTFASSSLKTLDFCSSSLGTVLTHHHTATILGLLTQKCPQLQKLVHRLRIIPYDHKHEFIEQSTVSQFVLSPLACGHLHNSRHLTFLSIKGQFINSEIFLALSCLPKLQIFSIEQVLNRNVNLPGIFNDAQLPEGSFPALQELQLLFRELDDFQAAWNAAPLVSGLATIYLGYIAAADATSSIYEDGILHSLLQRISASSSHANKLTLSSSFFREPPPIDLENSPWAHVRHLPLTHLKLRGFRVDAASLKNAQQVWPSLLVLEMPFQLLTLEHLARLSWLPQLRELHAAGFEYVIGEIPRMQCHAGAPLHMIKLTGLLSGRVEIRFVEDVARCVLQTLLSPIPHHSLFIQFLA